MSFGETEIALWSRLGAELWVQCDVNEVLCSLLVRRVQQGGFVTTHIDGNESSRHVLSLGALGMDSCALVLESVKLVGAQCHRTIISATVGVEASPDQVEHRLAVHRLQLLTALRTFGALLLLGKTSLLHVDVPILTFVLVRRHVSIVVTRELLQPKVKTALGDPLFVPTSIVLWGTQLFGGFVFRLFAHGTVIDSVHAQLAFLGPATKLLMQGIVQKPFGFFLTGEHVGSFFCLAALVVEHYGDHSTRDIFGLFSVHAASDVADLDTLVLKAIKLVGVQCHGNSVPYVGM